jgi:hypothetical protein
MREQHVAMPSRYREPAFAIQIELSRSLKHLPNPTFTHFLPLKPTILKKTQIVKLEKRGFSLSDNELGKDISERKCV